MIDHDLEIQRYYDRRMAKQAAEHLVRINDQGSWICRDCGLELSNANLAEWGYGCSQSSCEVGWHHTPCSRRKFHGSSRLRRRFK